MKYKVLCTAPFKRFPSVMEYFEYVFDGVVEEYLPYEKVQESITSFEGIIPNARIKLDKQTLDLAKNLKAIYQPSMGYEHIDIEYAKKLSIQFNALGLDVEFKETLWSTAEHTISLMLSLIKSHVPSVLDVRDKGKWDNREYLITDMRGLKIGIIGFGNIGKKVAHISNAFGADLAAYDPFLDQSIFPSYVAQKDLSSLLQDSDLISIHVPHSELTVDLISFKEIKRMKPGSYLINTSRGGIVNEDALIEALAKNNLMGAAVDVLEGESPFGVESHKLVQFAKKISNLIITPHLGGSSYPYMESIFMHSIDRLHEMLEKN